uniref:Retrovirus-related Pol polyprotein from transposon TNT 1-94-like beta-barrel domain-containing protein n=3 Tax=Timema TaxID=61471 RepID=A0A7R8ZDW7_TIMDO|nr:unnamed protein product [Timema douglasi]
MDFDDYEKLPTSNVTTYMTAGAVAGVMEHCVMYPLDSVKTQMQNLSPSSNAAYRGIGETLVRMVRQEGVFRPVRGMSAVVVGAAPAHALYFACYEQIKDFITQTTKFTNVAYADCWTKMANEKQVSMASEQTHAVAEEIVTLTSSSVSALCAKLTRRDDVWCVDSGATTHMCRDKNSFLELTPTISQKVSVKDPISNADGHVDKVQESDPIDPDRPIEVNENDLKSENLSKDCTVIENKRGPGAGLNSRPAPVDARGNTVTDLPSIVNTACWQFNHVGNT